MQESDLKLVHGLRRCGHLLYHKFNLNGSQMRILLVLRDEPMTQRELTDRLRIQPGSLSEILTKVERAGLIKKHRSASDRRNFELALTEEGRRQADWFETAQQEQAELLMQPLDAQQKEQLAMLLQILGKHWEEIETQSNEK